MFPRGTQRYGRAERCPHHSRIPICLSRPFRFSKGSCYSCWIKQEKQTVILPWRTFQLFVGAPSSSFASTAILSQRGGSGPERVRHCTCRISRYRPFVAGKMQAKAIFQKGFDKNSVPRCDPARHHPSFAKNLILQDQFWEHRGIVGR
jgi:hypothetical protein